MRTAIAMRFDPFAVLQTANPQGPGCCVYQSKVSAILAHTSILTAAQMGQWLQLTRLSAYGVRLFTTSNWLSRSLVKPPVAM